jgi:hypothetical protein
VSFFKRLERKYTIFSLFKTGGGTARVAAHNWWNVAEWETLISLKKKFLKRCHVEHRETSTAG